jgi:hypothetical protein
MKSFSQNIKERFDWDVTALDPFTDEQSQEYIEDLIASSLFLSRIAVQEGNKGSEEIKLLASNVTLQAATSCGWTPSGGVVLTGETLTTVRMKVQEDYCNEDLNSTWGQLLNAAGANNQDKTMPLEAVMQAYYMKKTQARIQDIAINGDTASVDPNLVFFDGFRKNLTADGTVVIAAYTQSPTITSANAYDVLRLVERTIHRDVKNNNVAHEIVCDYQVAKDCLEQVWNDKDFSAEVDFKDEDGEISFMLPGTRTMVRSYPQLDDTGEVYVWVYPYMFYGTDTAGDANGYEAKYNDTDEKMRFGVKFRGGVQHVLGKYFVRLVMGAS